MSHSSPVQRRLALAVVGLVVMAPSALFAQLRTEITPFVASYYGMTHIAKGKGLFNAGVPFTVDQNNAFAIGGRVTIPVGARLALEGEFAYAMSGVSATEDTLFGPGIDGGLSQSGSIIFGSVRAVFSPRRSNLFMLAGPAIIKRGGDAWKGVNSGDITDFGGVVGFGVRANVTPRFRLNLTAEAYLYSFDAFPNQGTDPEFQADVIVGLGIPISFGGH